MVKPKFTTDFPGAVVREGADELTLRAHEEGAVRSFIDTTNVGDKKDGGHRLWMRTSTPSATRDQHGRPRIFNTRSCTKRSEVRNPVKNKKAKVLFGPRKEGPNQIPSKV